MEKAEDIGYFDLIILDIVAQLMFLLRNSFKTLGLFELVDALYLAFYR
jgi:NADH:ubiquinone oxidoreductase subunit 3 (subunit A)